MKFRKTKYWGAQPYDGPLGPKIEGGGGGLEPRGPHGVGAYGRIYYSKRRVEQWSVDWSIARPSKLIMARRRLKG